MLHLTEQRTVPLRNFLMPECRGLTVTGIRLPQPGAGMLRYRTEMLDAGIPSPAASASVPMPRNVFH